MSLFTFLRPSVKSKVRRSKSDASIPSYEEIQIEVEKKLKEIEKQQSFDKSKK